MPKNFNRADRVADVIQRLIARLLQEEFGDPRIGMVTITKVNVSPDLKQAKIYVTVLEEAKAKETIAILNHAAGFFRGHLARDLNLRVTPKPTFIYDETIIRANRINSILEECVGRS